MDSVFTLKFVDLSTYLGRVVRAVLWDTLWITEQTQIGIEDDKPGEWMTLHEGSTKWPNFQP